MKELIPDKQAVSPSPTILITGAGGFIGGFLVEEALRRGYAVWAGIRQGSNTERLQDKRVRLIDLQYDDPVALASQIKNLPGTAGWDYVIHNAGITKTTDKSEFFRVNAGYTRHLAEALAASGRPPKKFLLMSSLSAYGKGDDITFRPILLSDPQKPDTAYGQSKLEAERAVSEQPHFPYVILRPTGVYGPGDKDYFAEIKSINSGFDFIAGFKQQRITFIYVKDLARAALLALENEQVKNKHYFVADGDVYTSGQFAHLVKEVLGKRTVARLHIPKTLVYMVCLVSEWMGRISGKSVLLNTDKYIILTQRNWICDTGPLRNDLPFEPEYPLRKGLEETIAWYRLKGWL